MTRHNAFAESEHIRMTTRLPHVVPLVLLAVVLLLGGPAVRAAEPQAERETQTASQKHFLWKVESEKATVYLMGSVHVGKEDLYPLDDVIENAFKKSDRVVFELPLDKKGQLEAASQFVKAGRLPKGDTLDKHLDEKTKKLLDEYGKNSKFPIDKLKAFRPWFVAITISQLEMAKHGYSPRHGVDHYFQRKAEEAGKPTEGLETYNDQIKVFTSLPEKTQQLFLRESLQDVKKLNKIMQRMLAAWKAGDAAKLDEVEFKDLRTKQYRPLYRNLIVERNKKWLKTIEGYLKTDATYFVVVGAGHLVGKDGLVELLKAKKYDISQL